MESLERAKEAMQDDEKKGRSVGYPGAIDRDHSRSAATMRGSFNEQSFVNL
jgi:hypothetical protein